MCIREAASQDLPQLLDLYTHLHNNTRPAIDENVKSVWQKIMGDVNHHIIVGVQDASIISSCVLLVVPNLTHGQRPYAVLENVVTHPTHRKQGVGGQIMAYAKEIAMKNHCYKIMLMTSSKEEATLRFYRRAGYNTQDKTAFVQWID
mgnify:CR=1 FL=1